MWKVAGWVVVGMVAMWTLTKVVVVPVQQEMQNVRAITAYLNRCVAAGLCPTAEQLDRPKK